MRNLLVTIIAVIIVLVPTLTKAKPKPLTSSQPPFIVDTKTDLSTYLPIFTNGSRIYCIQNKLWYVSIMGTLISMPGVSSVETISGTTHDETNTEGIIMIWIQ